MHRESILVVLGVLIAISPYVGLPYSWLMFVLPALGLLILAVGLSLQMRRRRERREVAQTHEAHPSV